MADETLSDKLRRQIREDSREEPTEVVAYETRDGDEKRWTGDDEAPYVKVLSTVTIVTGGGVPISAQVEGDVAHDSPDSNTNNFPIKFGGRASTTEPAAVASGDRVNAYFTESGRLATIGQVEGDVAHDSPDSNANNLPIKLGGRASTTEPAAVADADRVNAYFTLTGRLATIGQVEGDVAHDSPDSNADNLPIKLGGRAATSRPAAVADGDRVNVYVDDQGRLAAFLDQLLAGEDLTNNVLGVVEEPLAVAQHALSTYSTVTTAENTKVVKASAGRLYAVRVLIAASAGADRWLLVLNQTTAPTGGETAILWRAVLPTGSLEVSEEIPTGLFCSTGIALAWSTTPLSYTAPAGAEGIFHVGYK